MASNFSQVDQQVDVIDVDVLQFENLYPVLLQTFVVIVLGYLSGRWGIIGQIESKGLNTFVGNFALPCIIFTALAELDFSRVNWMFLMAILISKAAVFMAVVIFTLLLTRPMNFSKAGLFAIFCTQSNDFALGYPIVAAVYGNSHPEYAKYLYVMAPISLVLLNPLGFLCMEVGERLKESRRNSQPSTLPVQQQTSDSSTDSESQISRKVSSTASTVSLSSANHSKRTRTNGCKIFLSVWKNMLFTPIVLMTVMGIAVNFLCDHQIPAILKNLCGVLSSAFSATALFALGLRMVGKSQGSGGAKFVVPCILIGVKCIVMPIVTREVTLHLEPGLTANASLDLSNLGFLLGTFPSAPGILFYAIQYNVAVDMIATAMVAGTFFSLPISVVSSKMISLSSANPADYISLLDSFLIRIAIVGLVCTLFLQVIFLASKKWKKAPHFVTLCLTLTQCMACVGVILWYTLGRDKMWKKHVQFMTFAIGVFGSRIWTALLSVTLLLLRMKSLSFVLNNCRPFLLVAGWGIPVVLSSCLCAFATHNHLEGDNPNFQFGKLQALVASSVLIVSFTVTVVCLVWQQRLSKRPAIVSPIVSSRMSTCSSSTSLSLPNEFLFDAYQCTPSSSTRTSTTSIDSFHRQHVTKGSLLIQESFYMGDPSDFEPNKSSALMFESLFSPCDDALNYGMELPVDGQKALSPSAHNSYPMMFGGSSRLTEPEESRIVRDRDDEFQITRHVGLLLTLSFSMFVGIAVCVWTLVMEEMTGIYVMLLFLDETLNFGQGIFVLVIFGLEPRRFLAPFWSGLKRRSKAKGVTSLLTLTEVSKEKSRDEQVVDHTCEQFMMFYMDKCIRDLVCDRKWQLKEYRNVFCGNEMVDWLLLMGLARDRSQAEKYGQGLLDGGIINHVDGRKDFHDQSYFYSFAQCD
ncbi:integral membrane protein GPR155-like isoform X2 [Daphnia pulex]|uniref:integral membrane protein GPR155-like isoform X2 n=1 Tax=Daphnia pulex TaxID=6669 RepID=UPI001EDFA005|nr:integral membrane protein GPR155-like isoform X2 [Daphnia pulex]